MHREEGQAQAPPLEYSSLSESDLHARKKAQAFKAGLIVLLSLWGMAALGLLAFAVFTIWHKFHAD